MKATATVPKPVRVELRRRVLRRGEVAVIEGAGLAVDRVVRASREDLFDRALADEDVIPVIATQTTDIRRRSKSNGISSSLRNRSCDLEAGRVLDMLQNGNVEQVLQSGLVVAVQIGVLEHAVRSSPRISRWRLRMTRSCVSVPVLSVHSTSMAPKF